MKAILTMGALIVMSAGGFAQTLQTPETLRNRPLPLGTRPTSRSREPS